MLWWLLPPLIAYLIGSLSFAFFSGKIKGVDLREHGSGNLGATNAGRVLGKGWFFAVFLADVSKGLIPQLILNNGGFLAATELSAEAQQGILLITAIASILGHVFTLFHGFKGGKAVATSLGVLIGLAPALAGCVAGIWLLIWLLQVMIFKVKKSSAVGLASVIGAAAAPIVHLSWTDAAWSPAERWLSVFIVFLGVLVVFRHRSNIVQIVGAVKNGGEDSDSNDERENE